MTGFRLSYHWFFIFLLVPVPHSFGQQITLQDALTIAAKVNPKVQSLEHLVKAKEGAAQQADVRPNPSVGASASNRTQVVRLGQEFEYPGKRAARTNAALEEIEVAKSELQLAKLEIEQEVTKLFYDVLWAQKNVELLHDNVQITEKFSAAAALNSVKVLEVSSTWSKDTWRWHEPKRLWKSAE